MYFQKKRVIAMLLAGGQGSRLKVLTEKTAKPAVPFGGKYRIIDFPLSNCVNSGIDTVGILTQYQPLELNEYIGNGQPWNLNKTHSCAQVLPPYERHDKKSGWYKGTANAIYQNIDFVGRFNPDYVVMGETRSYNFEKLEHAVRLVRAGARLIGTNPDLTGPVEGGIVPATRALIAPIELATGKQAYFIGKPNPLMMRHALQHLGTHRADTAIIGDRMDTDVIAGIETELDTVLVLSGVTSREMLADFPYCPKYVLSGVGDIPRL